MSISLLGFFCIFFLVKVRQTEDCLCTVSTLIVYGTVLVWTGRENNAGQTILNIAQYLLASQAEYISKIKMQYLSGQKNEWMC